jgi:uncharacterized membrane protein
MALPKQLGDFSMLHNTSRFTIASAAGLLALAGFATAPAAFARDSSQTAPCYGVNACKGQSDWKSGDHACKGQNSCKGQGFKALTASECGPVIAPIHTHRRLGSPPISC